MLIIIEGHDKAGKTTLAKRLSKELNMSVFKHHKFTDKEEWNNKVDFMGKIEYNALKHIDFSKVDLIIDRFFMSNLLYNEYYNRGYDNSYINNIYEDFAKENVIYINMTLPNDILQQRFDKCPDEFIPLMQIKDLRDKYNQNYTVLKYSKMNVELTNINEQIGSILDQISKLSYKNALSIDTSLFTQQRASTHEDINHKVSFYIKNYDSFACSINTMITNHVAKYNKHDFIKAEEFYYDKIMNTLLAAIQVNKVEDDYGEDSRRFIFASTDCISCIHIFKSSSELYNINIYFRSSEALEIYPIDVSILVSRLIDVIKQEFSVTNKTIFKFEVMIGSSHYFLTQSQLDIDQNLNTIISAWKVASDFNKAEIDVLCDKYNVSRTIVKIDDFATTYRFKDTNIEFEVPHDNIVEMMQIEHGLHGDEFNFAKEHFDIQSKSFDIVVAALERDNFSLYDEDEHYNIWSKDGKQYQVPHYCKDKKLIDVEDEEKQD